MLVVTQLYSVLRGRIPLVMSVRWKYPSTFSNMLRKVSQPACTVMDNGLRVVTEKRPQCNHVTVGLFIDAGARYESAQENGLAHFFEHIVFKSTTMRDSTTTQQCLISTGARFSCFTEREMCGYYAECLPNDICTVVDILSDCVFRNRLDECEIEKQKDIVYQEMEQQDVDYNAVLFDYLHGAAFLGTSLARPVLGRTCNLNNFNAATMSYYLGKFFIGPRAVLAAVGCVDHNQLVELAKVFLCCYAQGICVDHEYRFTACDFRYRDDSLPYSSVAFAWETPGFPGDISMEVARSLLGGWDQTQPGGILHASPLARAAHSGLSDGFKSFYIKYQDTGLWGCHMFSKRHTTEDFVSAFTHELMRFCTMLSDKELERGKHQLKTQILSRHENTSKACKDIARWILYCGTWQPLHQQLDMVDAVTIESFTQAMDQFIYDKCPALAAVGNIEQLFSYSRLRSGFYWLRC